MCIRDSHNRFVFKEDILQFTPTPKEEIKKSGEEIIDAINQKINELQNKKAIMEGQMASPELTEKLNALTHEISTTSKLKRDLTSNFEEASRLREQQAELYKQLKKNGPNM